jgi:hypothetical protein
MCGHAMVWHVNSPFGGVVCSDDCQHELRWREALSIAKEPYRPRPPKRST